MEPTSLTGVQAEQERQRAREKTYPGEVRERTLDPGHT